MYHQGWKNAKAITCFDVKSPNLLLDENLKANARNHHCVSHQVRSGTKSFVRISIESFKASTFSDMHIEEFLTLSAEYAAASGITPASIIWLYNRRASPDLPSFDKPEITAVKTSAPCISPALQKPFIKAPYV
uniref:Uncharacterized protein n=1 Tax=Solanum lycopersicum TaxID=4081 RepID=A0A3Q7IMG9_SOLLC